MLQLPFRAITAEGYSHFAHELRTEVLLLGTSEADHWPNRQAALEKDQCSQGVWRLSYFQPCHIFCLPYSITHESPATLRSTYSPYQVDILSKSIDHKAGSPIDRSALKSSFERLCCIRSSVLGDLSTLKKNRHRSLMINIHV